MRALLPALGIVVLLAAVVSAIALTPALVFGTPDPETAAAQVGHTAPHGAPQLACDAAAGGTQRATLVAQTTRWEIRPQVFIEAWTFGAAVPGPALCANLGDRIEVTVENRLAVPVLFHTHLPAEGEHAAVAPGATGTFAFRADRAGSFPYHDLANGNEATARGLHGVLLVRNGTLDVDHEIVLALGEVNPDVFDGVYAATVGGRSFPLMPKLAFESGERVLVHLVNFGPAEEHTLHIHGHRWQDTSDGRAIDNKFLSPHTAVAHGDLGVPEGVIPLTHALAVDSADFLLVAESEGEWMYHCHVYDHINAGMTGMMNVGGVHHG